MTTDASVSSMVAEAAYPRAPRTIRLALLAAFVTAVLAGPATMILFLAARAALDDIPLRFSSAADMIQSMAELLMYSAAFGLVGSVPAAGINTLLLAYLARRRRDSMSLAIMSGLLLGFLVGVTIAVVIFVLDGMLAHDTVDRLADFALGIGVPFLIAGGFMGALHWYIAIRPRRRWRLFQERERAALLAME